MGVLLAAAAGGAMFWLSGLEPPPLARASERQLGPDRESMIARGSYLVTIGGCNDCHTPWIMGENGPQPDMSRMLSGHPSDVKLSNAPLTGEGGWIWAGAGTNTAFIGPWGVSYAFNLTPDPVSGLGGVWDEAMFIRAIRTGKHFGESRPILPPMPWQNYRHMTDEDLKAIWAYLQSIPPVFNEVPASEPAPPPKPAASAARQ